MPSELASIALFVLVGWGALWPARRCLGPWGYHIAALPVGILAAPLAATCSTLAHRPLDALSVAAGAVLLIGVLQVVLRVAAAPTECSATVGWRSFALASTALFGLAALLGLVRLTVSNNDSIVSYWPLGVQLARTGAFTTTLAATRSALIPSMNAIHVVFGSDWAYVVYPMLGATMLCWLAFTLLSGPLRASARRHARWIAFVAVLALALEPSFIFHSLFVHSHMVSGLYFLMSLTCIWFASRPQNADRTAPLTIAWYVVGGACTAGFALARPDGLAYQFVPVIGAISALTLTRVDRRHVLAFFGPLLFIEGAVYAATYATIGFWDSAKLDGRTTAAILLALAASAVAPWIVQTVDRVSPVRLGGERFFSAVVLAAGIVTAGALALSWETAGPALDTARTNLLGGAGGYFYLWYGVIALLVLSALSGDALRPASWTRAPFLSIVLFFVIAALVHGLSHEGRIGPGDSLNRVVFHVIPVIVWYVAAVVARILGDGAPSDARA